VNTIRAEVFVKVNDDLGIGVRTKHVAPAFEISPKLVEVVNFSVEDYPTRAIFVEHRLVTASQVNDAEAAHAKTRAVPDEHSFIVRAAVDDGLAHAVNDVVVNPAIMLCADYSRNSTHMSALKN
jgi:hypothetical protein